MDLSIIIINWNSKRFLPECIASIKEGAKGLDHEILVIDNASYDGSKELLAADFPHVRFLQSDENLGFARGNNRAAKSATSETFLFLNPDTICEPDSLTQLFKALHGLENAGAVGARLLNTDSTLQTSCIQSFPTVINQLLDCELLRNAFPKSSLWGMAPLYDDSEKPSPCEAISGACVMIKRAVFEKIGGFSERYFMYSEDLELSYMVQKAGFACCYVPTARVIHHGGGSSKAARSAFSTVMMQESVYKFMKAHRGPFSGFLYRCTSTMAAVVRMPLIAAIGLVRGAGSVRQNPSIKKWISIFRWSLGLETWLQKYK